MGGVRVVRACRVRAQIPFYEPTFKDLIVCEIRDASVTPKRLSRLFFSWKDLYIRQNELLEPRVGLLHFNAPDSPRPLTMHRCTSSGWF